MLFLLSAIFALFHMIFREKPDLIHVHWWIPLGLVTRFVCFFTRTPYVVTTHGTDVFILSRFKFLRPFAKSVFKHAQRVHVISSYVGSLVEELIPQKQEAIEHLEALLSEEASKNDAAAAIDALRNHNQNYFVDRRHSGKVTLKFDQGAR